MVSWIRIFQSRMRESTTSKHGITYSVAATTSASVTPGPTRSRFSWKAISPSARGWISSRPIGISAPSAKRILSVR